MNVVSLLLIVAAAFHSAVLAKTNNFNEYSGITIPTIGFLDPASSTCLCDLTPSSCDAYCCCDSDCPSELLSAWKSNSELYCTDYRRPNPSTLQPCSTDKVDYLRSAYWKPFSDALIKATCIYYDNTPRRFGNFYTESLGMASDKQTRLIDSGSLFPNLNSPFLKQQNGGTTFYQLGDPIIVSPSTGVTTTLPFPSQESGGMCLFDRPALYTATNQSVGCNVTLSPSTCSGVLSLARISALSVATGPDLATTVGLTVTYIDYGTGATRTTQTALASNCGTGDIVMSVCGAIKPPLG